MSDSVPVGDQQQSLQTEMKERAEVISVVLTTVLEEAGYASAVDQARKLFAHTTPAQMEQMKPHFSSLALEFMILRAFSRTDWIERTLRGSPFSGYRHTVESAVRLGNCPQDSSAV